MSPTSLSDSPLQWTAVGQAPILGTDLYPPGLEGATFLLHSLEAMKHMAGSLPPTSSRAAGGGGGHTALWMWVGFQRVLGTIRAF